MAGPTVEQATNVTLEDLGWSEELERFVPTGSGWKLARVASVYAARVTVWTADGPRLASLRSRVLRDDPPCGGVAVGDWALVGNAGADEVVVEAIAPRRTSFVRQAAGERAEPQAIAANVDRVFVVTTALDAEFNQRRIERYLVAIAAGGAEAQIVVTKSDLVDGVAPLLDRANALAPAFATSSKNGHGIDELLARIPRGTTAAVVGSSGVGKSALVNRLLEREVQLEGSVRVYDGKGRHTTTRRELFLLPSAGLLIDTPGMRELKPWFPEGLEAGGSFDDILAIAEGCRYSDCRHEGEPACAIRAALGTGELEEARFGAWMKLKLEQAEHAPRQAIFAAIESKRNGRSQAVALRKRIRDKGR